LGEAVSEETLTSAALAEVARGGQWVKLIADFPPMVDGTPSGPTEPTYPQHAIADMIAAVHAAGARVAAHSTTTSAFALVEAGVDSLEHGTAMDEQTLRLMAQNGAAWTPTLCAVLGPPGHSTETASEYRERLQTLLPLAVSLGVPVLTGTDTAGTLAQEIVQTISRAAMVGLGQIIPSTTNSPGELRWPPTMTRARSGPASSGFASPPSSE
jgi:imidazolonepropionase-like amidohydrolase